jgi:RNA polymerase sigma-70 factor (ECF subfamily)
MMDNSGQPANSESSTQTQSDRTEWVRDVLVEFEGPLVRYAQRITGDLESARDVVQETFLRLCRQDRDEVEGHLVQWLFTVCRNRALDVQRKERRMSTATDLDERTFTSDAGQYAPDSAAETNDSAAKALGLLEHLPDNQQEVIRLKFQNELSYREISDVTGLSVSNVGFLLHVGIKRLRELMVRDKVMG